ncbi:cytoplasmic dynein 1 intermediate chain 2-like [Sycon ciliatum]|uniref:cytoplasmic dynein 1 intermediate chain 2-like n=1 Tax=Sycon ciliatum TaxID=27933 RepID=UPI0020ABADCE|eukprot:scpid42018/ scgid23345/ Cytoplasmic dynein 1 intermediate chain 2; Cytoplasmic dynein intermediate chain 2; Dynein intermediate chain 2, cytosolic
MDRKNELERKKQKLEEMRKRRERERRERDEKRQAATSPEPSSAAAASASASARDVEGLVDQLIGGAAAEGRSPSPSPATSAGPSPAHASDAAGASASAAAAAAPSVTLTSPKKSITLTRSAVTQTSIPPKETVTYSKEIQTDPIDFPEADEQLAEPVDVAMETPTPAGEDEGTAVQTETETSHALPIRELSEEERTLIMGSQDFGRFFQHASKLMQRALGEADVAVDYRMDDDDDGKNEVAAGAKVKLGRQFSEDRWSRRRAVTCMDWSHQHPELLVASYGNNEEAPQDPDGVVLVWNSKFNAQTPEYIFHCQSAVMSTTFTRFNPHLILGGCYSGQIALWDIRSNKRTPVQRTPLSAHAHTHPVYCLSIVGTQNAHNLISVSTDGKMCSWSLDMLSQPQDAQELQFKTAKSVAVTSLSFPQGEVNNFMVGSEDGSVYTGCRHGSKAGIGDIYEGHTGPVTSLSSHTASGQVDFSNLFLTSSFDWTVKLWSQKHQQAIYSFETSSDYVFDVQWSPVHPAVFASVDGVGHLDLWNMNTDTEVPVLSEQVDAVSALNRVRWSSTGQQVACGNADGTVYIYDVGEHFHQPRNDEWTRFKNTLQDLQASDSTTNPESSTSTAGSAPY